METLKNLFDGICTNLIITRLVRERCQNNCGAPGVFWLRLEDKIKKIKSEKPRKTESSDNAIVFYRASVFLNDMDGTDHITHFKVCPIKEFHRIPEFDVIKLWNIPDTKAKYIGHLTEEEVDELLLIQIPTIEWNDFSFLLHECRLVSQPGLYPDDIACAFLERRMGLENWEPEDDNGDSLGEKRNMLWNKISYYQVCTQLLKKDSA